MKVKLSQLTAVLQPDAVVHVWRRQVEQLGIEGIPEFATEDNLKGAGNQPAVEEIIQVEEIK